MRKAFLLTITLILFCSLMVFAAGAQEEKGEEEPVLDVIHGTEADVNWEKFKGEQLNLLFVAHPWQEAIEPHIPEFEQLTGMDVNINTLSESLFWDRVVMGLQSEKTPFDLTFLAAGFDTMAYFKNGWLEPLDEYLTNSELTDQDWYNVKDINNTYRKNFLLPDLDGKLYGMPITSEVYMMWYRKDIFKELGVSVDDLETIDDWLAVTKRIHEETDYYGASIRGGAIGIKDEITGMAFDYWGDQPYVFGRDMYFDENWCPRFTHPRIQDTLETWAEVMRYAPPGVTSYTWYDAVTAFRQGLTGTYWFDASLFSPSFEDPEQSNIVGNVGYAVVPRTDYGHKTSYWSWGLGIPANAQNKEAAWLFIEWATSKYGDSMTGPKTWGPTRESTWENPEYTKHLPKDYAQAVSDSMQIIEPSLLYLTPSEEIMKAMLDTLHDIYGGTSVERATNKLQNEAKQILIDSDIIEEGQCQ